HSRKVLANVGQGVPEVYTDHDHACRSVAMSITASPAPTRLVVSATTKKPRTAGWSASAASCPTSGYASFRPTRSRSKGVAAERPASAARGARRLHAVLGGRGQCLGAEKPKPETCPNTATNPRRPAHAVLRSCSGPSEPVSNRIRTSTSHYSTFVAIHHVVPPASLTPPRLSSSCFLTGSCTETAPASRDFRYVASTSRT